MNGLDPKVNTIINLHLIIKYILKVFEVIHLLSAFVDLVSTCSPTLSKNLDHELDQIMVLIGKKCL